MHYIEFGSVFDNENNINQFSQLINKEKQNRISKIENNTSKKESILGEFLLKEILDKKYHIDYKDLIINHNTNNKPYINNKNLFYNISHSNGFVVCIVAEKECGIDTEIIKPIKSVTISYFATNNEQEYIYKEKKEINKRATEIYCLKEAYFKMKGTGLQNLKEVEFIISNNRIICNDKKVECQLLDNNNYIIAICIKKLLN